MKAIILAAGRGKRLGKNIPKPLCVLVNKKTILDFQIEVLAKTIGIENIILVVGYKKELFLKKYPSLTFVFNEKYDRTNIATSAFLALRNLNEDTICLAGDIYFEKDIIEKIIKSKISCCVVNRKRCGREEVKYNLDREGYISNLSKSVIQPRGEALGIFLLKRKVLNTVKEELERVKETDYFSKALENLIKKNKLKLLPIQIEPYFCHEIDFKKDLRIVIEHLSKYDR